MRIFLFRRALTGFDVVHSSAIRGIRLDTGSTVADLGYWPAGEEHDFATDTPWTKQPDCGCRGMHTSGHFWDAQSFPIAHPDDTQH